jgi:hypothetical protein
MVSEITPQGSKSPPPAVLASANPAAPAPQAAEIKVPAAPKVVAPKPVAIQFDPAKAQQNLAAAVNLLNEQMVATKRGLGLSFDNATGEVIRQIPTADVLHIAHKLDDLKGILYNKVA